MNPQERTLCIPILEGVALGEPFCGSTVVGSKGHVVILGWIRRGEPTSDVLLQLVTCIARSESATLVIGIRENSRLNLFISFAIPCIVTSTRVSLTNIDRRLNSVQLTKSLPYVIHR
jgi:hypothetical protein